jgi:methyl-accepting chemotaxis protein WspA
VKNWTIRGRILVSFSIVLALMIAMGSLAFLYSVGIQQETTGLRNDVLPGVYISYGMQSGWEKNYALTEEYLVQGTNAGRESIETQLRANRAQVEALLHTYESFDNDSEEQANLTAIQKASATYFGVQADVLKHNSLEKDNEAEVILRDRLTPPLQKIESAAQVLVDHNKADVETSMEHISTSFTAAKTGILLSFALAVLLALVCGYFLMRAISAPLVRIVGAVDAMRTGDFSTRLNLDRHDEFGILAEGFDRMSNELASLVGQVQKSGAQVNNSASEIAITAKEQQATASEIAATTIQIGATSKEISATSKELVRTMTEVSAAAEQSAALAGDGQAGVTQMETTMHRVMAVTGSVNDKLAVLNDKAANINQVVTTITKVADQTNLLSLNAAIEAEKAGEYGRGFSVVATEIRRLADQTAVATLDIEQTVKEIQSAVSSGVMSMDKFSEEVRRGMQEVQQVGVQLSQIIQQVQAMAPRFEAVNEGMQVQATGAEQISQALVQLSEGTRQTAESLRQSNQAIDELNQAATDMRDGISRFKLER